MKSSYQQILDSGTHGTGFDLIWVFTIWNEQTIRIWEMTYTIQGQVIDAKPSHWNSRQLHFYSVIEPVLKWRRPTHSFVPANFAQSQGSLSSFMLLNQWFLIWLCIDIYGPSRMIYFHICVQFYNRQHVDNVDSENDHNPIMEWHHPAALRLMQARRYLQVFTTKPWRLGFVGPTCRLECTLISCSIAKNDVYTAI